MYYTIRIRLKTKETIVYTAVTHFRFNFSPEANCEYLLFTDLIYGLDNSYKYFMRDIDELLIKPQC